ncbi:aminotransferase class IV [Leucobacter sp. USHLN153]|uniref:aminotransferase class IV n=1 Tax=Leucobacter sp. USHLN153 TaxID=3081268 RepID=UPI00301880A2
MSAPPGNESAPRGTETASPATESALLAADSFRVRVAHGRAEVRSFERHLARFTATATAAWLDADPSAQPDAVSAALTRFLAEARTRIAEAGEGFPRLELWAPATPPRAGQTAGLGPERTAADRAPSAEPHLALAIRPLPPLRDDIELVAPPAGTATMVPEREHPERKGPNIARYAALARELSVGAAAQEPLLVDAAGHVAEGATTSLVWWPEGSKCEARGQVSALPQRVASVMEATLREALPDLMPALATVDELSRSEVWAVNALHGVRPATRLNGSPLPPADPARLAAARAVLDHAWEPVLGR